MVKLKKTYKVYPSDTFAIRLHIFIASKSNRFLFKKLTGKKILFMANLT
jgi:hypothetical protein